MTEPTFKGAALITGASTGIGAIYADRLARRGHDLILVARNEEQLKALAERLAAETGVKAEVLKADLADRAERLKVEDRLRNDPSLGVLVNNAGLSVAGPVTGGDVDRLETIIELNITAATRLAVAAATAFAARGSGLIINVASVMALAPELGSGVYSGSKAYLLNLTKSLNRELSGKGVTLQAVLPGATRTEIWDRSGGSVASLPAEILMEADEMVDAALAGLDLGELVTIPSLPNIADWNAAEAARLALFPNLSRNRAAARYRTTRPA